MDLRLNSYRIISIKRTIIKRTLYKADDFFAPMVSTLEGFHYSPYSLHTCVTTAIMKAGGREGLKIEKLYGNVSKGIGNILQTSQSRK